MRPYQQLHQLDRLFRIAGALVPKARRQLWREEWIAEIGSVYAEHPREAERLAQGLIPDAFTLRILDLQCRWHALDWCHPGLCIRALAITLAGMAAAGMLQTHARHQLNSSWGMWTFLCFVILAVLAVPSAVVVSCYGACEAYRGDAAAAMQRFTRWRFLATKLLLAVPAGYLLAAQLTLLSPQVLHPLEGGFFICYSLLFNAIIVTWAFADQRQRCPTCMRSLRNPAHLGVPSWSLLHANATEEMCDRGHGLLHQPEWRTSWFENARWVQLDRTWHGLFRR